MNPRRTLLLAALALAACKAPEADPGQKKKDELPTRTVRLAPVGKADRVEKIEVIGELQGAEEIRVFAQVPERIRTLAVREGERVKAGDLIATVAGELQTEGVRQAEAALEAALANRDALQDSLKRAKALVEGGGGTRGQLETLEAQARAAEAQVRQATAAVSSASLQASKTTIRAPIAGVVAQLNVKAGDMASPAVPLATIVRDESIKAVLKVPERDFLRIREGMPARIAPLAQPEVAVEATVTLRGPVVDRMTRTGLVEIALSNAERKLLPGSAVRAVIELSRQADVIFVPAEAVILSGETERNGRALAFVAKGEKALRRDVTVGVRQGDQLEIKEGLEPGEQLVVQGAHFLRDQNPIAVADPAEKKAQP